MIINSLRYAKLAAKKIYKILEVVFLVNPKESELVSWNEDYDEEYNDLAFNFYNPIYDDSAIEWRRRPNVKFTGVGVISEARVVMCKPADSNSYYNGGRRAVVFNRRGRPFQVPGSPRIYSPSFISSLKKIYSLKSKAIMFEGSVALLGIGGGEDSPRNFYHFWADIVGDLWHIKKILQPNEMPDYYIVNFCGLPWQWDILEMCGLKKKQVIPYSRHDFFNAEKLILSFRDKGATNIPFWLSGAIQEISGWRRRREPGSRMIFISRTDASRRRVINEDMLREHLCRLGFEVYALDGLSVKEQQELFAAASVICSPHGAALTNIVWCCSGTVIIDLLSEGHLVPCFKELSKQNDLLYFPVICEKVNNKESGLKSDVKLAEWQLNTIQDIVKQYARSSSFKNTESI